MSENEVVNLKAGRNTKLLLTGAVKLSDAVIASMDPIVAMQQTFDYLAKGFGAQNAILLRPVDRDVEERDKDDDTVMDILAYRGDLEERQLGNIRRGRSAPGVSWTKIEEARASREPKVLEHPMHARGPRQTASLADNYSVLCAPVCNAAHSRVRAIYYFQNVGPLYEVCYDQSDLQFITLIVQQVERLFVIQEMLEMADVTTDLTLTDDYIVTETRRRAYSHRLSAFSDDAQKTADSLAISKGHFYKLCKELGIDTAEERERARRAGAEVLQRLRPEDPEKK